MKGKFFFGGGHLPPAFLLISRGQIFHPSVTQRKDHTMSKKCKAKGELVPWLSARPDNTEKRFIQVGDTLLFNKAFKGLTVGCRYTYFCMAMECGGRCSFLFPQATAKKYKITPSSLRRHVDELEAKGFLKVYSGKPTREPNRYEFCFDWKLSPYPRVCAPPLAISSKSDPI